MFTREQEIHCHGCDQYVQFKLNRTLYGNHVIKCPVCDHEHCRVIKWGRITSARWDSRNGPTFQVAMYTTITTSSTSTDIYYCDNWLQDG